MSKGTSDSKKLTLIYLQQLFLEKTDETHYVRMPEILSYLASKEVFVDRRTIYTDLKLLDYTGFEIVGVQEKGGYKYHHPSRLFSTNELKFLIDSVAASKFLTEKKSKELITKIKTLGSTFDNESFNRNILLGKRIKSMNEKVLKNLDLIYAALSNNSQITFQYMKWNYQRQLEYFKNGQLYTVSPFAVSLSDDNYYLIAYDTTSNTLRHYRIDKMKNIKQTFEARTGKEYFKTFDIVDYTQKTFGMFTGKEETVTFEVYNSLAGVFIERFGEAVRLRKNLDNPHTFIARATVNISPQFYAWVFGLGKGVKILSPESVVTGFTEAAKEVLTKYQS
ncbi:MAG: WYL domain-containing protein [Lachnospiraceae bacterium]|nr:WYL domain-containing protein [Lachnospiraceae bacterium]